MESSKGFAMEIQKEDQMCEINREKPIDYW